MNDQQSRADFAERAAREVASWPSWKLKRGFSTPEMIAAAEAREQLDRELQLDPVFIVLQRRGDIPDGFYKSEEAPLWFHLREGRVYGFTVRNGVAIYATKCGTFRTWMNMNGIMSVKMRVDYDRTIDDKFVEDYRMMTKLGKQAARS